MWECKICGLKLENEKVMRNHMEINHAAHRDRIFYVDEDKPAEEVHSADISSIVESIQNVIADANDSFGGGGGDFGGGGSSGDY